MIKRMLKVPMQIGFSEEILIRGIKSHFKQKPFSDLEASPMMVDFGDHTYVKKNYFAAQY